ncbi:putative ribonuclease H-like domain-containing protein [Tanacetum coccineum]
MLLILSWFLLAISCLAVLGAGGPDCSLAGAASSWRYPSTIISHRFKKDNGYHVVPPPLIRNYMPPLADLSFTRLDDSVYRPTANKTSASVSQVEANITPPSDASVEMPRVESVRPSGVIIEDWVSDDEDIFQSNDLQATDKPSFKRIEFTNARNESVKPKQAEKPRITTQNPKVDKRDWNEKMTQKMGLGFGFTKKACFVCGRKNIGQREIRPVWNNDQRINHQNKFVPFVVLTRSRKVQVSTAKKSSLRATTSTSTFRPMNTASHTNRVNVSKLRTNAFYKSHSPIRRSFYKPAAPNTRISNEKVNTIRVNGVNTDGQTAVSAVKGNRVIVVKASAGCVWRPKMTDLNNVSKDNSRSWISKRVNYIDPQGRLNGCSKHMTGNKDFLTDYQDIDEGFVAFGGSARGGKITRKGKIRTDNFLFTKTECLVLSPNFKLLDESQVLLRVLMQSNMYSFDLKNVVPSGDLTCLFVKAIIDESKLWHRRLGHVNFKTMNKLMKGNLVRGLPLKIFDNDHTCVACQKGKQHKASCKAKLMSFISQPLQMLHMDLFGPTSVRSINHKTYCLVVTDDFSRFSWVFFLASKDETKFKNREMNEFYGLKRIKREFSVARTPQQNGVVERKNKTMIEAARTMLVDSLLPTVFWAEAVNTACYVLNRVLVTKPHNKTPYELIIGRPPSISFMRPFGCPVTILNTLDPLGKFDGKAEEGFLVGYSINSKAFRVFNSQTRKVEENLHVNFLENKPNVAGQGPNWLFDIDSLTNSMNYQPVTAGNQTNKNAGNKYRWQSQAPRHHGGAPAQTRSERVLEKPNEPPLLEGHTSGSGDGSMEYHFELTNNRKQRCSRRVTTDEIEFKRLGKKRMESTPKPIKGDCLMAVVVTYTETSLGIGGIETGRSSDKTMKLCLKDSDCVVLDMKEVKDKVNGVVFRTCGKKASRTIKINTYINLFQRLIHKSKVRGVLVEEEPIKPELNDDALICCNAPTGSREGESSLPLKSEQIFCETLTGSKKFRAAQRAAEIRSKPPTKTQLRNLMMTYLKNTGGYKSMSCMKDSKRGIKILNQWIQRKKFRSQQCYEKEKEELRLSLKILYGVDSEVYYEPTYHKISTCKMVIISGWKLVKKTCMFTINQSWLVQERFQDHPLEGHDLLLWGDLKMLFDPDEKDELGMNQLDWKLLKWKLHENCGVHTLFMDGTPMEINMLVEKKYPLIKELLEKVLNLQLEAEEESTMAFELIKFIK